MPKFKSTYGELYQRQLNLAKFSNDYWALASISDSLKKSVMKYEKLNSMALQFLAQKEKALFALHVEHGEDGGPLFEDGKGIQIAGRQVVSYRSRENLVPVFKSADDMRMFNDEWMILMNLECDITT